MILIICVGIFIAVIFITFSISNLMRKKEFALQDHVSKRLRGEHDKEESAVELELKEDLSKIPFINRFLKKFRPIHSLQIWIKQSGMTISLGTLLLVSLFIGAVTWVIVSAISPSPIIPIVSAVVLGFFPFLIIKLKRGRRIKVFSAAFPDAVATMGTSLRAGYSLQMALESLIKDSEPIITNEFSPVLAQMEVGLAFEDALQKMLERIDTADLRLFVASVIIQRESGGNLSELLDNLESTIRERYALKNELDSSTGQAKLSGMILSLLPVFVAIFIFFIHSEYIIFFFQDTVGTKLFYMCLGGQITGMLLIRKIVNIQM